jgi:carbon monoxide dehydrogenase subunit G
MTTLTMKVEHTSSSETDIAFAAASLKRLIQEKIRLSPIKMEGRFTFHSSQEAVFTQISDPKIMAEWFPTLKKVELDHACSAKQGQVGVGSKRVCYMQGMGKLSESFIHWDAPKSYAYTASNWMMPVKNHVGIMCLVESEPGVTQFNWQHYYDYKGVLMRHIFPHMMCFLMNKGIERLSKKLGGPGGKMKLVKAPR